MSYVTNVILNLGIENENRLKDVNTFFSHLGFVSLEDSSLPFGWVGGTKALEVDLSIGAFNYLDLQGLVNHIHSLNLNCSEDIQLLVCDQDSEQFRIVEIKEDREKP